MMRVVNLHVEGFKRVLVADISPVGNVITIGGKNGNGKSSVLDAIYVALKGRAANPPVPVHTGRAKATIRLDLGDLIVTRTFTQKEGIEYTDTLKVENAEGLRHGNPQAVLNALLGEIGFDPFDFAKENPKKQVATILEMVPLTVDLDEMAQQDVSDLANRRDINRDGAALQARVDAIPKEEVPENAPDRDALTDRLAKASDTNIAIERERVDRADTARVAAGRRDTAAVLRDQAEQAREEAERLQAEAKRLDASAESDVADADRLDAEIAALPELDTPVDAAAIQTELRNADAVLALIDRQKRRGELEAQVVVKRAESEALTEQVRARRTRRTEALAKAPMPVPGLAIGIDDKGAPYLTWDGLPFDKDQISTAALLRVSTAVGMAANPQLRVLRIKDGSLIDEDSMAMLADMAAAEDFQLWIEVVGNNGIGIIMENGVVRGDGTVEAGTVAEDAGATEKAAAAKPTKSGSKGKPEGGLL